MTPSMTFLLRLLAIVGCILATSFPAAAQTAELVMFEAPGCPYCQRWKAEVGQGYPNSDEGKRAPLRIVPMAHAGSVRAMLALPVTASPTFVLMRNGKEVGRIVGYPGADFFWGLLAELISKMDRAAAVPSFYADATENSIAELRRRIAREARISVTQDDFRNTAVQ